MKKFFWKPMFLILLIATLLPFGNITNAASVAPAKSNYYFVYNSARVDAKDLGAIKQYAANFKSTNNVMFDAKGYTSAKKLYGAMKGYQKKTGGSVAGVQIFGVADDVPTFLYSGKLRYFPANDKWDGVGRDSGERFDTDFFYSTFKNDSQYLTEDIVFDVLEKGIPVSLMPEWSVARLPLTKGEIAGYVAKYGSYRKQIEGKSIPTAVFSVPSNAQDGLAQNNAAFFSGRLKKEFGLFKNTDIRTYTKDLKANMVKENQAGIADFLMNSDVNTDLNKDDGTKFMSRATVKNGLTANYYTAFFWETMAANNLGTDNIVHDGLVKGKMINAIAKTIRPSNGGLNNYVWSVVEKTEDGQELNDYVPATMEMLQDNNTYYFLYLYYEALNEGKSRSASLLEAKIDYVTNALKHPTDTGYMFGFEDVVTYHYLGLADYE